MTPEENMTEKAPALESPGSRSSTTSAQAKSPDVSVADVGSGSVASGTSAGAGPRDVEPGPPAPETPAPYTAYPASRQMFIVLIVTCAGFFAPLCGAVYLPSLLLFQGVFQTSADVINATVSVYMAVFAVTPLFGAAASDYGGRKSVYIGTLALFLVANTLLAAVPANIGALFVLRIFQALGASVVTSVGAGTIADITEPAKRASRMGIFLLGPHLGPVLGPLIGGQFSTPNRWRWIFGFLSIACFPVFLLVVFFLPETLRCRVGNGSAFASGSWMVKPKLRQKQLVPEGVYPKPPRPTPKRLYRLLLFVPNLIVSVGSAIQFSGLYCVYITFPRVWQKLYGWTGSQTGYAYLAPAVFLLASSLAVGKLSDLQYRRLKAQHPEGKAPAPERRIDIQIWGYLTAAAGKAMYGWFVFYHFHPAAGLAASAVAAVGTGLVMVTSTAYQTECQPTAAAMLVALSGLLRNLGSAISAAIIDQLLSAMGLGWCFTGLALLDALYSGAIIFLRIKGHRFRQKT